MQKFLQFLILTIFLSCQNQENHPYTFYYWRTNLSLNQTEKQELKKATIPYLYARFFDIEKVDGKFQPVAIITRDNSFETDKEIVPVVFIKNDVFYDIKLDEIAFLAKNVYSLIKKKQNEFGFKISKEIQIDCDWTAGTNKEYFEFLKQLQEISGKDVTCTLRLHQIHQRALSGVPPVEKVYLMCYSTSSPLEDSDKNSILELKTLKKYLSYVHRYPVDIDIVLPVKGFRTKSGDISDKQLREVRKYLDQKLTSYNIVYYHLNSNFGNFGF